MHFSQEVRWTLWAGAGGLAVAAFIGIFSPGAFFFGYLTAFVLWCGLPLGCLAVLMLHHMVGGQWGAAVRPVLSAAAVTTVLLIFFFLPVALGMSTLYDWVNPGNHVPEGLLKKEAYLNTGFFLIRSAGFFLTWALFGWLLFGGRIRKSELGFRPGLAAAGMILYFITISFASIDWIGSLDYEWYSTVIGLYVAVSQACTAFAWVILAAFWLNRSFPADPPVSTDALQDLSNLLFAFVVLHTYLAYSQYFIIWNGDLPHEIEWYLPRIAGAWGPFAVILIGFDFALPFVALLSQGVKRNPKPMAAVASVVLIARVMEAIWFVIPAHEGSAPAAIALMFVASIGIGGLWSTVFLRIWRSGPLYLAPEALEGGNV